MPRNSDLYRFVEPLPELVNAEGRGPVLIHGLEGYSDAGHAVRLATQHLREQGNAQLVAEFDTDQLIDFRSRRPALRYSFDRFTSYQEPALTLHALQDANGDSYLLLSGLEPDLKWDGFTQAVIDIAGELGVEMSVGLGAIGIGVPHTRPTQTSAHASQVELIRDFTAWPGEFDIPGSAGSLLELRLGEHGYRSAGFTVHVPQYLSQTPYPPAALGLLGDVSAISGLELPTGELEQASESVAEQIDAQISASPEILQAIEQMERQFDEFTEAQRGAESLNPGGKPLPSGDEIGAEFESFLAEQQRDGE